MAPESKFAFGYFNFEWSGNDVILHDREQKNTILLTGDAARKFEARVNELEEDIPHDKSLEDAVNELVASYFRNVLHTPPES
jgi:hypothetical protein